MLLDIIFHFNQAGVRVSFPRTRITGCVCVRVCVHMQVYVCICMHVCITYYSLPYLTTVFPFLILIWNCSDQSCQLPLNCENNKCFSDLTLWTFFWYLIVTNIPSQKTSFLSLGFLKPLLLFLFSFFDSTLKTLLILFPQFIVHDHLFI